MTSKKTIKSAMESMMFVWGDLLPAKDVAAIFDITTEEAVSYFEELMEEYAEAGRGIEIRRVGNAFQYVTKGENEEFVRRLCTPVKVKRLSQAALEVLAIIAYKQPVTKGEIDSIRGIKSDRVIEGLMRKELVWDAGRSDAVGRPILYRTTDTFLKQFGFSTLKELPEIDNIEGILGIDVDEADEESRQLEIEMGTDNGEGNI
ncbi:MAG: SMC-Scp complex subunit ScpB [Eubacterium sp.]|nr:SMC-Scp complex subunit ScpB [Eubacterium sp.]